MSYTVIEYMIFKAPETPTSEGIYYGKTPNLEQAQKVVENLKKTGQDSFIKCLCSDGKTRYYN